MTPSLPAAAWTQREDLARLVQVLGAEDIRWVGGAVRDTLLGHAVKDIDAATTHEPAKVIRRLGEAGIRTVPTGIDHGTVTALLEGGSVEVTTLRKDVSTDGRRATVAFASEWQDDAARRDFTINALYVHPQTLQVSDWFGGLADLELRRVRFIGDARERIREDHLRILRYYRFQTRFGALLDGEAEAACADMAPMLKGLSRERVAMELLALLGLPEPLATITRMFDRGVLPVVLPEVDRGGIEALASLLLAEAQAKIQPAAIRRLGALLPADPRLAEQVAARLRLSSAQRKHLVRLAQRLAGGENARALAYREGRAAAADLLLLAGRNPVDIGPDPLPAFPLKGGQIVARGVGAGPEVARVLQAVEARWIAEQFPGEERVMQLLDEALAHRE